MATNDQVIALITDRFNHVDRRLDKIDGRLNVLEQDRAAEEAVQQAGEKRQVSVRSTIALAVTVATTLATLVIKLIDTLLFR